MGPPFEQMLALPSYMIASKSETTPSLWYALFFNGQSGLDSWRQSGSAESSPNHVGATIINFPLLTGSLFSFGPLVAFLGSSPV